MQQVKMEISEENLQDLIYICNGVFAPIQGFMGKADYQSVIQNMQLTSGDIWTIPITLDVDKQTYYNALEHGRLDIYFEKKFVAYMEVKDGFLVTANEIYEVFLTLSEEHPGVQKEKARSPYRLGGKIVLVDVSLLKGQLNPEHTKKIFNERGFSTVVGFQTRKANHRAHEYLQRTALEICDGLFINPIVGWKKKGDFTEEAVFVAYNKMIQDFFPKNKVYLEGLRTQMRYAGPREAVFHAIIRRNLGCTHFIIGRDHAGVGNFYNVYAAHELVKKLTSKGDLGIQLFLFKEPYYCKKCGQVVTENTCCHDNSSKISISGTKIRNWLINGEIPNEKFMRMEISQAILSVGKNNIFIK